MIDKMIDILKILKKKLNLKSKPKKEEMEDLVEQFLSDWNYYFMVTYYSEKAINESKKGYG